MKIGVSVKIDVTKIDKARLFKGAKGTYLDLTTFIDIDNLDQYDNSGFISQSVTKEERDQGVQGAILGNVKVFYRDQPQQAPQQSAPKGAPDGYQAQGVNDGFDDDIGF
tara:strand:+ start:30658 stop:30984 length:327 start_codon:yes stop_codon:yes gene_type:complete